MNDRDRRRSPRYPVDLPAELAVEGSSITGRQRDLCKDAGLVEAGMTWPVGTVVNMAVTLDRANVTFPGTIIRVAPGEEDNQAMAVLFDSLPPALATRLDLFLDKLDTE